MNRFEEQMATLAKQTNDALREQMSYKNDCLQVAVLDAMRYSLLDAGKRLRAALTLEFGRISGAPRTGAMALACAVEMVHAYSLIHDDLPCMDDDDFRRGKPSCHRAYGEATALLAGDALLTHAFETIAKAPLGDDRKLAAVSDLAKAAGVFGMIGGQVIDLASEGRVIDGETLDTLCALKTGALLRAAARLGCIAGGADEMVRVTADSYARCCGLAFQITDDILDVTGSQASLGKPIGSDEENQKTTYVTLYGLDGARERARELVEQAKQYAAELSDNGFLFWVADMILTRDH